MSRYEDGYSSRGRPSNYYTYSTTADDPPPSYSHLASPGGTTYNGRPQQHRLTYEPHQGGSGYYPPRSRSSHSRPRSLAPPAVAESSRERGDNKYGDSDDSDDGRTRSPVEKAKRFVDSTFTDSTTGLGVGVLGALVGGLAAREAVDLTSNQRGGRRRHSHGHGHNSHDDDATAAEHRRNQLISTVVGAAVGALGANAVEKRIETRRARDEIKQERWEKKWRRPEGADAEVLEKMEVVAARPRLRLRERSRSGDVEDDLAWGADEFVDNRQVEHYRRGGDEREFRDERDDRVGGVVSSEGGRKGIRREVDPAARSWKTVEDWRRGLTP